MGAEMKQRLRISLGIAGIGLLAIVSAIMICRRIALYRPVYRVLECGADNPWKLIRCNYYLTDCQANRTCKILHENREFHFRVFNYIFISRRLSNDADQLWKYTCKAHE